MCGIFAWLKPRGSDHRVEQVREITNLMSHRGPDGEGVFLDGPVALGHRRLSIIDLELGQQPMIHEDQRGKLVIVFNGEIYNYDQIRLELKDKGHTFTTGSDTEVILKAYREWEFDCLSKLNGMFAFALWDSAKKSLFVARDRMGVKPLYYRSGDFGFACASEIRSIRFPELPRSGLNESVLDAYFTLGYVPGPETMFEGIRKLEPGCYLEVSASGIREERYWDFGSIETTDATERELLTQFLPLLEDCVRKCTVSDVPLGAFLSGGLDSSATVAMMAEVGIKPVNTFTAGFNGVGEVSEESYAQAVADRYRCRHFVHNIPSGEFWESLNSLVKYTEEPLVEPAAVALFRISELARSEVKVLLSGEGADEVLGGYSLYRRMLSLNRINQRIPDRFLRNCLGILPGAMTGKRIFKYIDWLSLPLEERYRGTSAVLSPMLKKWLYHEDFFSSQNDYLDEVFSGHFARISSRASPLSKMLYVDSKTWLSNDLLLKADKMTMAASVELRVPFLDHRLVEFASSLPDDLRIRQGQGKWILKETMKNHLPEEIIWRKKMGFPVPTHVWLSGDLFPQVQERLRESDSCPWIKKKVIDKLIDRKPTSPEQTQLMMSLLVFNEWRQQHDL